MAAEARPEPSVARAAPEDAPTLTALRRQFWEDQLAKGLLDPAPALDDAGSTALIGRARTSLFVARHEGEPLGYVFGQTKIVPGPTPSKVSSIEEIFVLPGRRIGGVARRLFAAALADFREAGADRIQLRVLEANEEGRRFWLELGFRPNVTIYELDPPGRAPGEAD